MHVHRQHNGHQCHENRGADGKYRIAVFACTEYRYQDTSTKIEQKNLASTGLPNASGMEITANTIAVIALLEMGFFVELLTLLIRTILLLQFDILCIGS